MLPKPLLSSTSLQWGLIRLRPLLCFYQVMMRPCKLHFRWTNTYISKPEQNKTNVDIRMTKVIGQQKINKVDMGTIQRAIALHLMWSAPFTGHTLINLIIAMSFSLVYVINSCPNQTINCLVLQHMSTLL